MGRLICECQNARGNEARSHGSMNPNKADREELTKCLRKISGAPDLRSFVCPIAGGRPRRAQVSRASGVSDLDLVTSG